MILKIRVLFIRTLYKYSRRRRDWLITVPKIKGPRTKPWRKNQKEISLDKVGSDGVIE